MEYFILFLGATFSGNYVLMKFLGICPFLGVSKRVETAAGMGAAVTFVITMASIACWTANKLILQPLQLEYLQTIAFILIIAALVQFVEIMLKKNAPTLYTALGVYLPLITTNCVILGVAILNVQQDYNLIATIMNSLGAAAGFTLALVIFAGIRERLELADIPRGVLGFPIALITAGLLAFAFMGFLGMV